MTAFDKFALGQRTYNGQDILKNHILNKHPVHYTDDTDDYSQVDQYADKHDFVWLVENGLEVLPTFPWFFTPSGEQRKAIHLFPYIYKHSKRIKSWKKVQLVPTKNRTEKKITQNHICAIYDFYKGKDSFDIFYLGGEDQQYHKLKEKFDITCVESYKQAQELSETDMFWLVPDDVEVSNIFKFSYQPDDWSHKFTHVFVNGNQTFKDGIALFPKSYTPTEKELQYRYYANKKELNIIASKPKTYPVYNFKSYEEYEQALVNEKSDMFWYVPDDVEVDLYTSEFDFTQVYFEYKNHYDRNINHVYLNGDSYDGIVLFSKHSPVTKKEFDTRFYANKKEHPEVATQPKKFDQFIINDYNDYELALANSTTEMFWGIPSDVDLVYDLKLYFSHHNLYDRNINHVFLNGKTYDGVALYSKNSPLTQREIETRFFAQKKEWDFLASKPKPYDVFEIDSYDDYLNAIAKSVTNLFWASSRNIEITDREFVHNFYISHHSVVDQKQNHVFAHVVNDKTYYNGLMLLSKECVLTEKEILHRFPAERKEWNTVVSGPKPYETFVVDSYFDYLDALETCETELFWATSNNIKADIPDLYFVHENEYDRKSNHAFVHDVNGVQTYNGLYLFSKHKPVTQREIEHRHIVERKEWPIVGSGPVEYEKFYIETYDDYQAAMAESKTEMFWALTHNVRIAEDFDFDIYFSHDNEYDRKTNHAFAHVVDNKTLYNGIFLMSKHAPVTQKEIEHRFIIDVKEWNTVASGPVDYDVFEVDSYEQYLDALQNSKTEMFWMSSANITANIPNVYFTHDNEYDRKQNHAFLTHNDLYNGLYLMSKHTTVTQREIEHRHVVERKEWDTVASGPVQYNRFYIETYNDYLDALENSKTEMFWGLSHNVDSSVLDYSLYFDHSNEYDRKQNHAFLHCDEKYNGVFLFSKHKPVTQKEIEHRHLIEFKPHDTASTKPVVYDYFDIDSYTDYLDALENSKTEMFWMGSKNIDVHLPDVYFTHDNEYDRTITHAFKHSVNGNETYNGLFLCSKHSVLTEKEIEHRHPVKRKEWDVVGSGPVEYDHFYIETYADYLDALERSKTELFWADTKNINTVDFDFDTYFTHDNEYDRKTNHAFVHRANGKDQYNGLFLLSKHSPVTQREIENRFIVNVKEWKQVGSTPVKYDYFEVDSYTDYLDALDNSKTELFWAGSKNIEVNKGIFEKVYFTHDNEYDRKQNHVFKHIADGKTLYNGLFLLSKHKPLTQKEVEFRYIAERKEWDLVGSGNIKYDKFVVNNYDDYMDAVEKSTTEMFWAIPSDVDVAEDFDFDMYFSHDNEYDRNTNHVFLNDKSYDGIALFSTHPHAIVTENEVEHRFYVYSKKWDIVASTPKPYPVFTVQTYDDYLDALDNSETDLFWATTPNISIVEDFDFDIYFDYQNKFDREINHAFIHRVNGEDHYNGLFLLTKLAPLTQKEVEHRLIAKRKEWDVVASGPVQYDRFVVDTYEDYENALQQSTTEMFWMIPPEVELDADFDFDLYFTHNQWFERETNHVFKNGNAWDGISLVSKKSHITEREINMRFLTNKKQYDVVASNPKVYDIVFISKDEEHADANYAKLLERFPRAKRVHGVEGIHAAHIAAAKLCDTDMIWIVDADAEIIDKFAFDYYVPAYDPDSRKTVHVWKSQNPINGLVYGYGAVKLLPRELTLNMDTSKPDMTTSISPLFKTINRISNITKFNTDEFSTWRSAFRETVKLSARAIDGQLDEETEFRLNVWCTRGKDKPFGKYCIAGANAGKNYGESNRGNLQALRMINNFDWLRDEFDKIKDSL